MGLLHRRTDAFLHTTCVHRLAPDWHLGVGLSFWDPAVQRLMREETIIGAASDNAETGAGARRLSNGETPRYIMAFPVEIDGCIEAIIELGRSDAPFEEASKRRTMRTLHALNT